MLRTLPTVPRVYSRQPPLQTGTATNMTYHAVIDFRYFSIVQLFNSTCYNLIKSVFCHFPVDIPAALSSPQRVSLSNGLPERTSKALAQQQLDSQSHGYEHTGHHVLKWQRSE